MRLLGQRKLPKELRAAFIAEVNKPKKKAEKVRIVIDEELPPELIKKIDGELNKGKSYA